MSPEVKAILDRVKQTADFCCVTFDSINDTDDLGNNALHCVVIWGDYEAAKTLIKNGINVNQRGEHGFTPLHEACSCGRKEMVELLLEHGADVRARTEGDIPFTTARLSGHDEICELLKPFMEVHDQDESGQKSQKHLEKLDSSIKDLEKQIKGHRGDKTE